MTSVQDWKQLLTAVTADGFFKVAIRRHPSAICWSWALEWNFNYRIIGFFGDESAADGVICNLAFPEMHVMGHGAHGQFRFREETLLNEMEDLLFAEPS